MGSEGATQPTCLMRWRPSVLHIRLLLSCVTGLCFMFHSADACLFVSVSVSIASSCLISCLHMVTSH